MHSDSQEPRLTPEAAALVQEFLRLSRRRLRRNPALTPLEHQRWLDLRWRIEDLLVGPRPQREGPPRKSLRVPARYKAQYADSDREEIATIEEIAEGGLFLATDRPMPVGSSLHLKLTSDAGEMYELEGAVVWIRRPGEDAGPPGMGVQFESLDDTQREAIAHLVEAALLAL